MHSSSAVGGNSANARGGPSYIGDLGGLDDLRRATDERLLGPAVHVPNAKSVTIHPDVTEFRYPGESLVTKYNTHTQECCNENVWALASSTMQWPYEFAMFEYQ